MSLKFGDFELDQEQRQLLRSGQAVPLEPKAYELLCLLLKRRPDALSRAQIRNVIWPGVFISESTLGVVVNSIRQALEDDARQPRFVRTVHGFGYAFCGEARETTRGQDPAGAVEVPNSGDGPHAPSHSGHTASRRRVVLWSAVGALAVSGAVGWGLLRTRAPEAPAGPVEIIPFTTDGGLKNMPGLSPDGERVAYTWTGVAGDNGDIYVKGLGLGSRPLRLTRHPGAEAEPVWSPDGRQIAFVRLMEGDISLHTVPSLGGQERKLIDLEAPAFTDYSLFIPTLSWSPDGEWLALAEAGESGAQPRIVRLSLATLEKHPLTSPSENSEGDFEPSFSPDGTSLAFVRSGTKGLGKLDIWIQPAGGGEARRLTSAEYDTCHSLAWTTAGDTVVFSASRIGLSQRIHRVGLDGGDPEPVLGVGENASSASIRASRMVYVQSVGGALDIWRVPGRKTPPADRVPERLIVSSVTDRNPVYSPDGGRIAFESPRTGRGNIWIGEGDGSDPVQMTSFATGAGTPRWSPDGRSIVFDSLEAGNYDLYVFDVEGGRPRQLTRDPSSDVRGTFSRDGQWIYFASDRSGHFQIWKMPATGGEAVQVTQSGGVYAEESWEGGFLYYSQREEPCAVSRVPVEGGEEIEILREPVSWTDWALSRGGIYFTRIHRQTDRQEYTICLLEFGSDQATELFRREGPLAHNWLSVSPDEDWLLFTEGPYPTSDLVLVEGFR